ncbi:hypothetical protein ACFWOJ_30350 [Streptomyces sp. NPDC058439]|uniref:hypothetical protein n=1 Tax=Streptomyces sp. NPDC058439 TaxID=3346500 RepID=UPI003662D9AD
MHTDHPPRRTVAVLAGLSCLFLPLLAQIPKASAASDAAATSVDPQLYYGGSVQLQSMIVASGNYWVP